MKATSRLVLPAFALCVLPSAAIASQASAPSQTANTSSTCELRIITAKGLSVSDSTDFRGGGVIGDALSGLYKKPDYQMVTDAASLAIGPDGQEKLIRASLGKLPERLVGYQVTFERGGPEVLDAYKHAKQSPRITTSRAPCVAEISVVAIAYIRTSVSRGIDCLFMFREFGVAPTARRVTIYANGAPARAFPAKTPDGVQTGNDELSAAFSKMFLALLQKLSSAK
jgi:hypothetical protein